MKALRKIAFLLEEFELGSPAQQLLDRFLLGYPQDGVWHTLTDCQVSVHLSSGQGTDELRRRADDFGLVRERSVATACSDADAIVVISQGDGAVANEGLIISALEQASAPAGCFVHGALANSLAEAKKLRRLADSRNIPLLAGTPLPVTWRLPQRDLPPNTPLKEALIIVQGQSPAAELHALEGLLPVIERRSHGESGIRRLRYLEGNEVWEAGKRGLWSGPLLAAAISRSNTPQGDPVRDGRTQDLVGLGLVPKLARNPRGWLIEHGDKLRSTILVLDGVIADYCFAVETTDGEVISAQIYRPPAPPDHQYSRLAVTLEEFFRTGLRPWPWQRNILIAGFLEAAHTSADPSEKVIETPELVIAYGSQGTV